MQNKLEIFNNSELGSVRTVIIKDEPYFVAKDVAIILGYRDAYNMVRILDNEDTHKTSIPTNSGIQEFTLINESGLYSAILRSNKPQAKQFKKWVTGEVLPTIRKTGGYVADDDTFIKNYLPFADDNTKALFKQTLKVIKEQNQIIEKQNKTIEVQSKTLKEQEPKVAFADAISSSKESITIGAFAKIISDEGVVIGRNKLFEWLRNNKILMSGGNKHNQPYQRYIDNGYFEVTEQVVHNSDGTTRLNIVTKITGKGQEKIFKKLKRLLEKQNKTKQTTKNKRRK